MYIKSTSKTANKASDIMRYFQETDLANSLLFRELPKLPYTNQVQVTSKRYDLLANRVYGNANYAWVLQMYNGIVEKDLKLKSYLPYPSLDDVLNLILSLDDKLKT